MDRPKRHHSDSRGAVGVGDEPRVADGFTINFRDDEWGGRIHPKQGNSITVMWLIKALRERVEVLAR